MHRSQAADFTLVNMVHRLRILYLPTKAHQLKFTLNHFFDVMYNYKQISVKSSQKLSSLGIT